MYIPNANNQGRFSDNSRRIEQELFALAKENHEAYWKLRIRESGGTDTEGDTAFTPDSDETTELVANGEIQRMEPTEKEE